MLPEQLTEEEILHEVIRSPRYAFLPLPDLRQVERHGWFQIITPSFRNGGFNEVALSILDDDEADAVIDATIAEYDSLGIKFRWRVTPDCAPADLGARLARRGLIERPARGMARRTDSVRFEPHPEITVEAVDAASIDAYTHVMATGWAVDPAPLVRLHDIILATPDCRHRLFLARCDGEPAGVAIYVAFPRSAYLLGGVVLPRFRGRGVYRALVEARLADARARGIELATSHAREHSSAPILERMGFVTICRFPVYEN